MEIEAIGFNFSVCKVTDYRAVNLAAPYCFIGKTEAECSLVCITEDVPCNTVERDDGWKAFRVKGTLDFSLVGVLSGIAALLAEHGISILAISTYDTDYVLTKAIDADRALSVLAESGYRVT